MPKIIHAADFHLDSPFEALPENLALQRRQEQRKIFERFAQLAREADIVLLPGDLLDSARSYYETSELLVKTFAGLDARVFIAPGNHDFYSVHSPWYTVQFPENVKIFKSSEIESVDLPELGCTVWGAAFTSPSSPPLLRGFSAPENGNVNIMLLHADAFQPQSPYSPISEEEIAASNLDYLALGHVHTYSGIKKAGGTAYAYSGCPEGRGFDETGVKGLISGRVEKGFCELDFVPLGGRNYGIAEIDAGDLAAPALPEDPEGIYRIVIKGERDCELDLSALLQKWSEKYFYLTVKDETRLRRELWEEAGRDTLKGIFLKKLKTLRDAQPDEEKRRKIELAALYGLAALENREEPKKW